MLAGYNSIMMLRGLILRLQLLRVYQWTKNLLVFLPLIAAHKLQPDSRFWETALGFVSFCLIASSGYVVNDLMDRKVDAIHHSKHRRPLAAGKISTAEALIWLFTLLCIGLLISLKISPNLFSVLLIYFIFTLFYSLYLKKVVVLDVVILAFFYTIRIIGGGVASGVVPSSWLIAFAGFIFFSLAVAKRYAELVKVTDNRMKESNRRDYQFQDASSLKAIGIVSCFASVILLANYVNDDMTRSLYSRPDLLLLLLPIFMYWSTLIWIKIGRGEDVEDPVFFILKDRKSYLSLILILIVLVMAKVGI